MFIPSKSTIMVIERLIAVMKNSYINVEFRRKQIVEILEREPTITVNGLADILEVSRPTIRRDLTTLQNMGLVKRSHGGAVITETSEFKPSSRIVKIQDAIARVASSFVKDGDTIFINTSQTALHTLSWFGEKRVNVITNNVKAAHAEFSPNTTIILTGGEIRFPKEALVNDFAIDTISKVHADVAIMGCSGISATDGVTTEMLQEAKINSLMVERAKRLRIIVADYRKIKQTSNFLSSNLSAIDYLITDIFANPEELLKFEQHGIQVIVVDPDSEERV